MSNEYNDPFASLPAPDDSQFDTSGLELESIGGTSIQTEEGALSLVPVDPPDDSEAQTANAREGKTSSPEVWLPGEYQAVLTGGKKLEGIPTSASISINMGTTTFGGGDGVKRVWFHDEDGKHFIHEENSTDQTPGRNYTMFTLPGNKVEITEGETIILGRESNDDRDPSEQFDMRDKKYSLVSRRHLSVSLLDGKYNLDDLNSTNGSFVKITVQRPQKPPEPKEEPLPRISL